MEKVKEIFLIGFVVVCLSLIFTLWANAFFEKDVETPYFYRGVPELSNSFYATGTAIARQALLGTIPPTIEEKHRNATPTATATVIPTTPIISEFTPESDG